MWFYFFQGVAGTTELAQRGQALAGQKFIENQSGNSALLDCSAGTTSPFKSTSPATNCYPSDEAGLDGEYSLSATDLDGLNKENVNAILNAAGKTELALIEYLKNAITAENLQTVGEVFKSAYSNCLSGSNMHMFVETCTSIMQQSKQRIKDLEILANSGQSLAIDFLADIRQIDIFMLRDAGKNPSEADALIQKTTSYETLLKNNFEKTEYIETQFRSYFSNACDAGLKDPVCDTVDKLDAIKRAEN